MKTLIVLIPLLAIVLARPQNNPDADAKILRYESDNIGVEGYKFGFDTSNGISRDENAQIKNAGSENEAIEVHGSFSYTGADGKKVTVNFVADENGFRPETSVS